MSQNNKLPEKLPEVILKNIEKSLINNGANYSSFFGAGLIGADTQRDFDQSYYSRALQQLEEAQARVKELEGQVKELTTKVTELKTENEDLYRERIGEVWYWQGDGNDHLETLNCPVLIKPDEFLAQLVAERRKVAEDIGGMLCVLGGNLMIEDMEAGKKLMEQLTPVIDYLKSRYLPKEEGE